MFCQQVHTVHNGNVACRLGTTAYVHQPQHQRGGEPDSDQRLKGNNTGTAQRVQSEFQPLRQEPHRPSRTRRVQELPGLSRLQHRQG